MFPVPYDEYEVLVIFMPRRLGSSPAHQPIRSPRNHVLPGEHDRFRLTYNSSELTLTWIYGCKSLCASYDTAINVTHGAAGIALSQWVALRLGNSSGKEWLTFLSSLLRQL